MKQNPRSNSLAGDFFIPDQTPLLTELLQSAEQQRAEKALYHVFQDLPADAALHHALTYHFEAGGQRIRMAMALATGRALNLSEHTRHQLALAVELLHNASLIHDDIQDQDLLRRGQTALWAEFGTDLAILAGDYLLSAAYGQIAQADGNSQALVSHLHQTITKLIAGQADDLNADSPTESIESLASYERIVKAKSGTLLALPMELALIAANHSNDIKTARYAGECFSVAYQIADDLQDLNNDVRQGCLNVIHSLLNCGDQQAISIAVNEGRVHCAQAIEWARQLPCQCGAFLIDQARQMDQRLSQVESDGHS